MHPILALKAFFRALFKGRPGLAGLLGPVAEAPPEGAFQGSPEPALQLLALFQKEGRLVDFLMEDVQGFSDQEIGAAVRPIHEGCRRVLQERVPLERIEQAGEGTEIDVPEDYDASAISVVGQLPGAPPYRGVLNHAGWKASAVNLPTVPPGADAMVVAPAEVEVR